MWLARYMLGALSPRRTAVSGDLLCFGGPWVLPELERRTPASPVRPGVEAGSIHPRGTQARG